MKKSLLFFILMACFFVSDVTKTYAQPLITIPPTSGATAVSTPPPVPTLQPPCDKPDPKTGICAVIKTGAGDIPTDPTGFVKWLFGFILGLGGTIALLLIIFSGYKMMSSNGDPEKIKGAKETLTSALVGLLFLIFSMVILQVITGTILGIPFLK